jgi:protein phosphatase
MPQREHTSALPHRLFTVCGSTDIGSERTGNQDRFVIADLANEAAPRPPAGAELSVQSAGMLVVVCDGMGGRPAGDVAAEVATSTIADQLSHAGTAVVDAPGPALESAVNDANRAILEAVRAHPEDRGMGTTCTAAVFGPDHLSVVQVGDSRAYLLRHGQLSRLTRDQTMAAEMVDAGLLQPEEVPRFKYRHVLSQALGTERLKPVITDLDLEEGDRVLLCSDGLHGPVPEEAIAAILQASEDAAHATEALITAALAAGGPDNVTAVVADCGPLDPGRGGGSA